MNEEEKKILSSYINVIRRTVISMIYSKINRMENK